MYVVAHMVLVKLIGIDHPSLNNVDQVSLSLPEGKSISRSFFFGRWTVWPATDAKNQSRFTSCSKKLSFGEKV